MWLIIKKKKNIKKIKKNINKLWKKKREGDKKSKIKSGTCNASSFPFISI